MTLNIVRWSRRRKLEVADKDGGSLGRDRAQLHVGQRKSPNQGYCQNKRNYQSGVVPRNCHPERDIGLGSGRMLDREHYLEKKT